MGLSWRFAALQATNVTLQWILNSAFHARQDQVLDLPNWAKEQHFDITAKLTDMDAATAEKLTQDQHRALLLALLTERFGLKYHVETKQMPTYDLAPGKDGPKLTAALDPDDKTKTVYGLCGGCASSRENEIAGHGISTSQFAELLAAQVKRDVYDRTGFQGKIDVKLKWARDSGTAPVSDEDAALPSFAEALQTETGLRLVPTKGPVKLYVIDHLDQPTEN